MTPYFTSANRLSAPVLVGRAGERQHLLEALARCQQGRGQAALLAGPAGIGKTFLAQFVADEAARRGMAVRWGRCLEEPGAPPYWPWRQLIRSQLRATREPGTQTPTPALLSRLTPIVAELASDSGAAAAAGLAAHNQFALYEAVDEFWRGAAAHTPLLLILDDLHWADHASLRLLEFVAGNSADTAVFVLGLARDTDLGRDHPLHGTMLALARLPAFRQLSLPGFSARETEQFIAMHTGAMPSPRLVDAVQQRGEGHPLFVRETLALMGHTWQASPPYGTDTDALLGRLPAGVRDVVSARLQRLSATAQALLATAACIGRSFELAPLEALEPGIGDAARSQAIEEAHASQLIEAVPGAQAWRFGHALIREVLYDSLLPERRMRLHQRIGEWIEGHHAGALAPHLPQLAWHFAEAAPDDSADKGISYARQAAQEAARSFALEDAARFWRLALRLQAGQALPDGAQRCALLLDLGAVLNRIGEGEAGIEAFQEAARLSRERGLHDAFLQAAIGCGAAQVIAGRAGEYAVVLLQEALAVTHPATADRTQRLRRIEAMSCLCRTLIYDDQASAAIALHAQTVALARREGDARSLFGALSAILPAVYVPSLLPQRLAAAQEAWALAQAHGQLVNAQTAGDDGAPWEFGGMLVFYVADLVRSGDAAGASAVLDAFRRFAERERSPYYLAMSISIDGLLHFSRGQLHEAEALAVQVLASARGVAEAQAATSYGVQMFALRREQRRLAEVRPLLAHLVAGSNADALWRPGLALVHAELGDLVSARREFDALPWDRLAHRREDADTLSMLACCAEVCVHLGDAVRAALLYKALRPHQGSHLLCDVGGPYFGAADRMLGMLAAVCGQWADAERHFDAALANDEGAGAALWLAHSRHEYARMLVRRKAGGDLERARALLDATLADSARLGLVGLAARAQALRQHMAAPVYPCGLSEREVGVLRLVAMGRNNREIGQVLGISPNTVANHIRSILEKTYTANRTEAAAFARREGLLTE